MSANPWRGSGRLLLVGSILVIVGSLLTLFVPDPRPLAALTLIGGLLALLGFPAAYRIQAKQVGRLGFFGFLALFLSQVLLVVVVNLFIIVSFVRSPEAHTAGLAQQPVFGEFVAALAGSVLGLLGALLFGVMTLRAHIFPAAAGWLLLLAGVLSFALFGPFSDSVTEILGPVSQITLYLAIGLMGFFLATRSREGAGIVTA